MVYYQLMMIDCIKLFPKIKGYIPLMSRVFLLG